MKKQILIAVLVLLVVGCKTIQPTGERQEVKTKTITELVRDTIVTVKADSSFYKAWIDCVGNKPIINPLTPKRRRTQKAGSYLKVPKATLKNNVLRVDCEAKAQELFLKWKEKHIKEQKEVVKTITLPPKLIPKPLTWWQKFWIGLGKVLAVGIIIFGLTKVSWKSLLRLVGL